MAVRSDRRLQVRCRSLRPVGRRRGLDPCRPAHHGASRSGSHPGYCYLAAWTDASPCRGVETPLQRSARRLGLRSAGSQTGVSALPGPSGWHAIGHTSWTFFDPSWPTPSRARAGRYHSLRDRTGDPVSRDPVGHGARPAVQDLGRFDQYRWGIGTSGAMDDASPCGPATSFSATTRTLAGIEIPMLPFKLRFGRDHGLRPHAVPRSRPRSRGA